MMNLKIIVFYLIVSGICQGQKVQAPANPPPDKRFKTDILLILAHPDDETAIGSFLAKMVFDEQRTVSAVYLNRGDGGGNSIGNEQSLAMANIREIEVRRALAKFGIFNVWILDGGDTPAQDLFHSLQNVHHGAALEKIVRLIRLTRAEVIISWMPVFVAGENHGDHQAAAVLATEAFDLAGDPLVFPAQVTVPRDRLDIANFQEGLQPWQPKKLYYFSDRDWQIGGPGPHFDISEISESQGVPYYQLAARLHTEHLVQGDVAQTALQALQTGDFSEFVAWLSKFRLIFAKALVPCQPDGDVFAGIRAEPIDYISAPGYQRQDEPGIHLKLGGVFDFYKNFHRAHAISHLDSLVAPEIMVTAGSYLHLPLLIVNHSPSPQKIKLDCDLPQDWQVYSGAANYDLRSGETYPAQTLMHTAFSESPDPFTVIWRISSGVKEIERVKIKVYLREWTLPQ
jgi:LmbE family N-acetylglucosaminyl deacetylase